MIRLLALIILILAACAAPITPMPAPTLDVRPITIVTLGDSLTFGDKDDAPSSGEPGGGWPRRLRPLFQAIRPATQIVNLARPGWTSRDLRQGRDGEPNQIDRAAQILTEAHGDKIATVWIGVNDLFYLYEFGDPTEAEEAREADRFEADLAELLDRLQDTGARLFIARLHDPSRGSVQASGVFRSITAEEWEKMAQQAQRYNAIIAAQAAPHGAALVDVATIFSTPAWMFEDGIHPNARGYDELTTVWHEALIR